MNKKLLSAFLAMAMLFSGCADRKEAVNNEEVPSISTENSKSSEAPVKEAPVTLLKTASDSEILTYFWENYIDDTSFTIVNGGGFASVDEISPGNMCSYLYLKIQRDGKAIDIKNAKDYKNNEIQVPAELMKAYAKKYFGDIDLVKLCEENPQKGGRYLPESDAFTFDNVHSPDSLPKVSYNQIEEFPNSMLESVSFYSDDTVIVKRKGTHISALKPKEEFVYFDIKLKKRGENDYYFVSAVESYTKTDYIKIDGEYKTLNIPKNLSSECVFKCENDFLYYSQNNGIKAEIFKLTYNNSSVEKIAEFPINSNDTYFKFLRQNQEKAAFTDNKSVFLLNFADKTVESKKIPQNGGEYVEDISSDFEKLIMRSDLNPIYILDLKTGEKTVLEATRVENKGENPMQQQRYADAKFVLNDKKVLAALYGYEAGNGYSLIDLQSGKNKFFDNTLGFETISIVTDEFLLAQNVMSGNKIYDCTIDFEAETVTKSNERPLDYVNYNYTLINLSRGELGVGINRLEKIDENIGVYTLEVVNSLTGEKIPKKVKIEAPREIIRVFAVTPDNKIIL
ncbi:MAG: hypothetical protein RR315_01615, partial [Oscillospiraceae bacterium]